MLFLNVEILFFHWGEGQNVFNGGGIPLIFIYKILNENFYRLVYLYIVQNNTNQIKGLFN